VDYHLKWISNIKPQNYKINVEGLKEFFESPSVSEPQGFIGKSFDNFTVKEKQSELVSRLKVWNGKGYKRVSLYNCDGQKFLVVHRLVAQTFMPNPENKSCVNHKDCNKQNNRIENLEWVTNMENSNHAKVNNRLPCGENHKSSKFTLEQIMKIRENPERLSRRKLSIIFKTSHSHIRRIQENQVWNSIKLRKEGIV